MAAALTMIDGKQDKALSARTLKKHHLVRAKAAVSMVAWVAMVGGKPGEGSYDLRRLGDGRRYRLRPAILLFRINVWSMGVLNLVQF
jgi:hypothetical protein